MRPAASPPAQYIEGFPGPTPPVGYGPAVVPGQSFGCADVDTCDQQYNPTCVPGSANYPINAAITDDIYTRRASRCNNNLGYCSPYNYWCCAVKATPCTKQAEVIAIYDGAPPSFNLINEGVPDGITLTYVGAPAYRADSFGCGDVDNINDPGNDPSTQYPQQRTFTLRLTCDKSAKTGISGLYFGEPSSCQYIAYGGSALACGAKGDPFNNPYTPGDAFGFVVLGATLYGFCYIGACACLARGPTPASRLSFLSPTHAFNTNPSLRAQCTATASTSFGGSPSRRACPTCLATCPCGWAAAAASFRAAAMRTSLWAPRAVRAQQRPLPPPSLPLPTAPPRGAGGWRRRGWRGGRARRGGWGGGGGTGQGAGVGWGAGSGGTQPLHPLPLRPCASCPRAPFPPSPSPCPGGGPFLPILPP